MNPLDQEINQRCEQINDQVIAWRRDIHQHPELGNQEFRTSKLVAEHLRRIGVDEVYEGLAGGTGVLGILHGGEDGPIVGLRADMDALPIKEATGLPFASKETSTWGDQGEVPVMHACGHDMHTAMLMGAATVLCEMRAHLKGKVVFVFQPAEEGCSSDWEGKSGAARFIEEPVYMENRPEAFFGQHVWYYAPPGTAGKIGCIPGIVGYNMDIIRITIHGQSTHGNRPWLGVDSIIAAAHVLTALQTIPSKNTNVYDNSVTVTMGMVKGGTKFNVVADTTVIEGALRFTDRTQRDYLESRFRDIVNGVSQSLGCTAEIEMTWVPALYNDPELLEEMKKKLDETFGEGVFCLKKELSFANLDDYSWYTTESKGLFYGLSIVYDEDDPRESVANHRPDFNPNEAALCNGVKVLVASALKYAN